ncbi:MAG: hypothetical protein HY817_02660 [Candidatus Abawacabacteria bacterium]|nr:hypothetical protein [Candidatus Abawacabacteria bacterium]
MKKLAICLLALVALPILSLHFLAAKADTEILPKGEELSNATPQEPIDWAHFADFLKPVNVLSPRQHEVLKNNPRKAGIGWEKLVDAMDYEVELACEFCADSKVAWSKVVRKSVHYYTHWITPALAHEGKYRFRVRGIAQSGLMGPWSDYRYFTYDTKPIVYLPKRTETYGIAAPKLLMPQQGEMFKPSATVDAVWEPLAKVLSYEVELGCRQCKANQEWITTKHTTLDTTLHLDSFQKSQEYRFRVRALDTAGKMGIWSDYRYFTIQE